LSIDKPASSLNILERCHIPAWILLKILNRLGLFKKKMAPTCEKNVQIKLTPKNFLLIIFNVVYIEVNETRKKL
jgi:hypothetical protein